MLYHHECISAVVVAVPWRVMLPVRPLCIMVWKYAGTCIAIVGYRLSVLELRHSSNSRKRVPARITGPMNKSWESFRGGYHLTLDLRLLRLDVFVQMLEKIIQMVFKTAAKSSRRLRTVNIAFTIFLEEKIVE